MKITMFLFLVTAILGVFLFLPVFKKRRAPKIAIYFHGIFAIISVSLLTKSFLSDGRINSITMVLFALAALNGLYMFFVTEIQKRDIPAPLLILHANLAAVAFITLIYYTYFI